MKIVSDSHHFNVRVSWAAVIVFCVNLCIYYYFFSPFLASPGRKPFAEISQVGVILSLLISLFSFRNSSSLSYGGLSLAICWIVGFLL